MNFEPAQEENALRAQLRQVVDSATAEELQSLAMHWQKKLGDNSGLSKKQLDVPSSLKEPSPEELAQQLKKRRADNPTSIDHQTMHEQVLKGLREV